MSATELARRTFTRTQIARESSVRTTRIPSGPEDYLAAMAPSAMGKYLAQVVRAERERAGRKPYNVASAPPGMRGADPSTIWRFEQGLAWPRNPDLMIDLYAADLGVEPIEIWARALELWRSATPPR